MFVCLKTQIHQRIYSDVCMLVYKVCTSGTCIRFDHLCFYSNSQKIHRAQRSTKDKLERSGSNFVGAKGEIAKLLKDERSVFNITGFCTSQNIEWKFIPEQTLHFGGLQEAAVKSLKLHLKKVLGEATLNFKEFTTVLVQVETCLNSRPLTPIPEASDTLEVLTSGHFLIGRPITVLHVPDESDTQMLGTLRRWKLCQTLVRHLQMRWSHEYLNILNQFTKWHSPNKDYKIGDIVCLRDGPTAPTRWPLVRIVNVYPGEDGKVRVVTVKTAKGIYKSPVVKVIPQFKKKVRKKSQKKM